MGRIFKGDKVIWFVILFLSLISMLAIYSATGRLAFSEADGNTTYYLIKQLKFILGGCGIMLFMVHVIPVKLYSWISPLLLILTFVALIMALVQHQISGSETPRSLNLKLFSFQPAELAKIALIVFAAKILSKSQSKETQKRGFWWVIIPAGAICGIIFYGNVSTAIMIFVVIVMLMLIGRTPMKYIFLTGSLLLAMLVAVYFTADYMPASFGRVHTVKERIDDFFGIGGEEESGTTQDDYAKLAIYEGGFLGKGPGNSEARNYMAAAFNDFIYSIIIEEYGLAGGIFVTFLFLVFFYRGVAIVRSSERTFPALMAAGFVLLLVMQAFINMGVSVGILPVTGQPLPWIGVGGTSMLFTATAIGIILTVSYRNKAKQEGLIVINLPEDDVKM